MQAHTVPLEGYPLLSSGCDWITATAPESCEQGTLGEYASQLLTDAYQAGERIEAAALRDYRGQKTTGLMLLSNEKYDLVQLSGNAARRDWWRIAAMAGNVSRLDWQCTIYEVPGSVDLAQEAWDDINKAALPSRGPRTFTHIHTRASGHTLYAGAPDSMIRCRLYDKHSEAPFEYPKGSWRYETQMRGKAAVKMVVDITSEENPEVHGQRLVYGTFQRAGIEPLFRPAGPPEVIHIDRKRTTDDRRLEWLRGQVGPAIKELVSRGRLEDVIEALGLAGTVQPVPQHASNAKGPAGGYSWLWAMNERPGHEDGSL